MMTNGKLFSKTGNISANKGYVGVKLFKELRHSKIKPTETALDFVIIALSVVAADKAVLRRKSPDGWTREIELTMYLHDIYKWGAVKEKMEWMLRFLTGNFWILNFCQYRRALFRLKIILRERMTVYAYFREE